MSHCQRLETASLRPYKERRTYNPCRFSGALLAALYGGPSPGDFGLLFRTFFAGVTVGSPDGGINRAAATVLLPSHPV